MVPLIEQEIVGRRRWISPDEFSETLALAQSAPGPISINSAVFVGYKTRGFKGVLATVFGTITPPFIAILLVAMFFHDIRGNEAVERVFNGLRPAVVALIAVPVVNMLKKKNFAWNVVLIAAVAAIAISVLNISPIYVIILAAIGGIIYHFIRKTNG